MRYKKSYLEFKKSSKKTLDFINQLGKLYYEVLFREHVLW